MNDKYTENEKKINEYKKQIKSIQKKHRILEKIDNIMIAGTLLSFSAIFIVNYLAVIPAAIFYSSSYLIQKKQDTYPSEINKLTIKRGILETENRKILDKEIEDYRESQKYYSVDQNQISYSKEHIPGVYDTSSDSLGNLAIEHRNFSPKFDYETSSTKEILTWYKEKKQKTLTKTKNL